MYRLNKNSSIPNSITFLFQYFKCIGWINIAVIALTLAIEFQYFKCIGWILPHFLFHTPPLRFNTSNVSVEYFEEMTGIDNFAKVSILQMYRLNPSSSIASFAAPVFQYFKCIGWIDRRYERLRIEGCFNTSNVSVEYKFSLAEGLLEELFQYFKCIGWIL